MKKLKWIVEFAVSENWIEDGFNLTKTRAEDMLLGDLKWARRDEISAKIIKCPDKSEIRKLQGGEQRPSKEEVGDYVNCDFSRPEYGMEEMDFYEYD